MAFSEVREYQYGDDIRSIDWNVTARFNHPYVKIFEEERELTVILLIDVSGSRNFGTQTQLKKNMITEISAVLSFSAIHNNDKIGVILFSDHVEKFIPPKKGRQHILRIIRELIDYQPVSQGTNIAEGLRYFTNAIKKRCTAFLISDFMDDNYEEALRIAHKRHDLIALNIYDLRETELPPIGMVRLKDAETGKTIWVDTSSRKTREQFRDFWKKESEKFRDMMVRTGLDSVSIRTDEDYVPPLMNLFKRR
jgi:uncharacterized protein (DUF58 family)